ncbi:MAG: class I SAM-dependent methyltransferase [Oligoflexia bacterium]|nr:class I SAM-dependent methyltransferase [Oligoflexia bacterium]
MGKVVSNVPDNHYSSLAEYEEWYWWHISRVNQTLKIIRSHYKDHEISSLNVVDYGCGTGGFLALIKKRLGLTNAIGVDVSPVAINHASKYGSNYFLCSKNDCEYLKNKDLILCMDVLEHIENPEKYLKNFMENLAPKGRLLLSVPAMKCLFSDWDKILGHYKRYTKKDFQFLSQELGFKIIFLEYSFFSLFPIALAKRVFLKAKFTSDNCEFPKVSKRLNKILLKINQLEIYLSGFIKMPFGTTLYCLLEKT